MPTQRHKTHLWILTGLALAGLLLGACAAPARMSDYDNAYEPAPAAPPMMEEGESAKSGGGDFHSIADDLSAAQTERMVIKNADLSIVVSDPSGSMDAIGKMAEAMGGYVVNANMYKQELDGGLQVPRASISIRIPAEQLNNALDQIKAHSQQDPLSENINSQDVTSDYVDLGSRLKNLEAAEAQLAEIMDEAFKTEDVLSVYNQLVQVREQIEVIKGQMKYYEESARLSSISVELIADAAVQPLTIGGWQPVGVAKSAIQALIDTVKFLINAAIWIVIYVLPVLLLLYVIFILPFSFVWRAWRKRRKGRKEAAAPPPAAAEE